MVELRKKASAGVIPFNSSAIVTGLVGVTVLNGNQPYPDQTNTPSNLVISAAHS